MLVSFHVLQSTPPIGNTILLSSIIKVFSSLIQGGCLRNMMEFEDSGIPTSGQCTLGLGRNLIFLKKSLMTCHLIYFLMENYGMQSIYRINC